MPLVKEVVDWATLNSENVKPIPTSPSGNRIERNNQSLQELMGAIARWRDTLGGGGGAWGSITGTLADQTDLQAALDAKAPKVDPVFTGSFTSPGIDDNATSTAITIDSNQHVAIEATKRLYFDGGGDTHIAEASANIMRFTAANVAAFDAVSTGIRLDDSRRIALGNGSDAKFAFINAVGLQLTLENGIPFQILDGNTGNAVRFDFDVDLGDLQIDGNLDLAYIDGYAGTPTDGQSLRWNSANARAEFASQTVTTVATTSGTGAKDLSTTIPAWATEITISLSSFSTNGTVMPVIQVGNGTYVTTGYLGSARRISGTAALHSTGFRFGNTWAAAYIVHGSIKLVKHDSTGDIWSCFGNIARSGTAMNWVLAGSIDLSGALDRVRVTIGADTYDGGSIAIRYS